MTQTQENEKLRDALKEIHALVKSGETPSYINLQILALVRKVLGGG